MASNKKLEDLNLSRDEIKRLGDALKDEQFRKMLVEYAEEISDPENRRRYEEEIAQMENERGMDVTFIRPEPGYVLKTSVNGEKKAFINVSQSDKIDKPSSERKNYKDGKSGLLWHIPHSFAPPRDDYDKQRNRCLVYDFVVHPDTYRMAESNAKFKQLVEDTAIDGIEKQFQVSVDRKNITRPKMSFKGTPAATVIRNRSSTGPQPAPDASGLLKDMPYPYEDKSTAEKMKERENDQKRNDVASGKNDQGSKSKSDDAAVPKYTITHSSEMDMQEYRNAPDAKPSTRPRALVIKIELPLLKSASQANLDIFEKRLMLESKSPAAYKLDLSLPYRVDDSEGSAKFDKQKRTLIVTLPVVPEKTPELPTFINGSSTDGEEGQIVEKPLIEVLSNGVNADSEVPLENGISGKKEELSVITPDNQKGVAKKEPNISYTQPDFSFTQDGETVSFVLKVKNVLEDSIRRTSPSGHEMKLVCTSRGEGGFPLHYCLYLRFAESCQVTTEHCSVDVTSDNVVLLLLKERKCRGLWDRFWAGLDSDNLEERLFLTTSNLQQQLSELDKEASTVQQQLSQLDKAAKAVKQMAASPASSSVPLAEGPPCNLEVTAMDQKKLTIKIAPPKASRRSRKGPAAAEEEEEYDPLSSSAEIEVVHTQPSPNLHGILKQRSVSESSDKLRTVSESSDKLRTMSESSDKHRTMSESSDDILESPRSPGEEEDELSSSCGSSGKRRSVSFSQHIDKATFKSSASVTSMKTVLKSKRKRQRKWEERTEKASSRRRRHNSTGSEGSGDDHSSSHHFSDSHSHSEDEEKGQGDRGGVLAARLDRALDLKAEVEEGKASGEGESASSSPAPPASTGLGGKPGSTAPTSTLSSRLKEGESHDGNLGQLSSANGSTTPPDADNVTAKNKTEGSKRKGESIANKVKSKMAEAAVEGVSEDSDDEEAGKGAETEVASQGAGNQSGQGASNPADAYNEHRTECGFEFSNDVMFDLDAE